MNKDKSVRKINFGIIGCGRIAQRHGEHVSNNGVLKAVCDTDYNKAKELSQRYNATMYDNIDELLDMETEIDVISICSPNGIHAENTIKALIAGFLVLCEKPMAINVHDC